MSGERLDIWEDVNVKAALADGRAANDICLLNCSACGHISYYNQGTWFTCRQCSRSYYVLGENEKAPVALSRSECIRPNVILTLEDVSDAEIEDY